MRHTAQICVLLRTQGMKAPSLDLLYPELVDFWDLRASRTPKVATTMNNHKTSYIVEGEIT